MEYNFCHDYQNSGCRRALCKFIHCTREEEEYYKQTGHLPSRLQQAAALGLGVLTNKFPVAQGQVRTFLSISVKGRLFMCTGTSVFVIFSS